MLYKVAIKLVLSVISKVLLNLRNSLRRSQNLSYKMPTVGNMTNESPGQSATTYPVQSSNTNGKRCLCLRLLSFLPCMPKEDTEAVETYMPLPKSNSIYIAGADWTLLHSPKANDIKQTHLSTTPNQITECLLSSGETKLNSEHDKRDTNTELINRKHLFNSNALNNIKPKCCTLIPNNCLFHTCKYESRDNDVEFKPLLTDNLLCETRSTLEIQTSPKNKTKSDNLTTSQQPTSCPICLDSFETTTNVQPTQTQHHIITLNEGCKHHFCYHCLRLWTLQQIKLKRHLGKCPVCHYGVVDDKTIKSVLKGDEIEKYLITKKSISEGDVKPDDQHINSSMIEDLEIHGFKRCKGCGIAIQQDGHLDDLRCRCGFRFCFVCGESLGRGSFFQLFYHQRTCKGERTPTFFSF